MSYLDIGNDCVACSQQNRTKKKYKGNYRAKLAEPVALLKSNVSEHFSFLVEHNGDDVRYWTRQRMFWLLLFDIRLEAHTQEDAITLKPVVPLPDTIGELTCT